MARLTALSGVGGKLPAAFLLEAGGRRILLDLGEGPEKGVLPDLDGVGRVDALCLSHAHMDHAGALHLSSQIGNPPVYATAATLRQIAEDVLPAERRRTLPVHGPALIAGLPVLLGRSGHAPGGVWFHFPHEGGFLYMGDWSAESDLLPFDMPPPAACMVTDASYGDEDTSLSEQIDAIASAAAGGAVLPVPSGGRGPEMALALRERGLDPQVCPTIRAEMEELAADCDGIIPPARRDAVRAFLARLGRSPDWRPADVIIAAEANGEAGLSAKLIARRGEGFRFLFSSHVPAGTPAARMLSAEEALWFRWNVHPRLSDNLRLARSVGAWHIMTAFAKAETMTRLREELGDRLTFDRVVELSAAEPKRRSGTGA